MKKLTGLVFFIVLHFSSGAQFSRYIIRLKDKQFNNFSILNPSQFLSQRAIDRRIRYNIPIDSTDLPVTQRYIDSIRLAGAVTILNTSKWLNQVAIRTTDATALARINNFPFVVSAAPIGSFAGTQDIPVNKDLDAPIADNIIHSPAPPESLTDHYSYGRSNGQVKIHQGQFLHNLGFRGEGMHLAMLDAGFYHYLSLPTFDSIRQNNQVLGTWDFVDNHSSVDEDHFHGMYCLSSIAANMPGVFVGTAPKTSFYLFRTEDVGSEYPIEEQNYAAGLERADSLGVNITSTSLGYFHFDNASLNYSYSDMNGNITISSRAADLASKKGMLNIVAAGNEGANAWHYLITPSDADSVLSVGAVDTLGNVPNFSSYGPSSDNQVKPGVASVGWNAVVANTTNGQPVYANGTSLACPNMAGLVTCLWQAFPELNNMQIISALQQSASRASNPNDRIGYGIPNMKKAFASIETSLFEKNGTVTNCFAELEFKAKTGSNIDLVVERKDPGSNTYTVVQTFQGQGNFAQHNFEYSDDLSAVPNGIIKYRASIRVEGDTTFYLDSLDLQHNASCIPDNNSVKVKPNPVIDDLTVTINRTTSNKVAIVLQNAAGQVIFKKQFQQIPGSRSEIIPMKKLSRGIYFLAVYVDDKKIETREILR